MVETALPNGVHVLTERIPGVRSAAVGVWVRQGAAHERSEETGASHLLEHMVFKGTRHRSAREIALALESLGGALDAYTSREHTSYQARVLDEHLPQALDVLADLVLEPLLRDDDLELEREVVLEEIATVEDTPDDLVFDLHGSRFWGGHAYGNSILGTRETVSGMSAETLRRLHHDTYQGRNLIVAAAGNVHHDRVVDQVEALFRDVPEGDGPSDLPGPGSPPMGHEHVSRESVQAHMVFGGAIPRHSDPRRYGLILLSQTLGGGMSSRLFQRIREELGLAYSVYTFHSFYALGGLLGVYLGTRPATAAKAAEAVREELDGIASHGLDEVELDRTRQQVKGQIMLSLESTGARLFRLAGFALHREPFIGLDELLGRFDALSQGDVSQLAADFLSPERQFLLSLGPSS
jgi:predicted Zn-dependent peptidase